MFKNVCCFLKTNKADKERKKERKKEYFMSSKFLKLTQ